MRIKLFSLVSLALLLAACGPSGGDGKGGHGPGGGIPPAQVSVITVEPKALSVNFEYTGQTLGSREVEVRARVTGILQSRNFIEGGPVAKGQSLFTIDPAPFVAAAARAEADLKGAKARLTEAHLNLMSTKVEAPVSGITGRAQRSEGTLVSGPEVLLTTVTQVNPIWVSCGVPTWWKPSSG